MCSIQKICPGLSLSSPRNLAVIDKLGEGVEKCIKENENANFCYLKEKCVYISYKQKQPVPTK